MGVNIHGIDINVVVDIKVVDINGIDIIIP